MFPQLPRMLLDTAGIAVGALVIGQPEPLEPPSVLEEPVGCHFHMNVAETEIRISARTLKRVTYALLN
jgi:hypothetical protein